MKHLRPELLPRKCSCGKDRHQTWTDAMRVAKRMERNDRIKGRTIHGQEPYRCQWCGDFHLTSNSYTKPKKKRVA